MQVPGLAMSDPVVGHVQRSGVDVHTYSGLPSELIMYIDTAFLAHHGPETRYRPYLHLSGEIRSIRPGRRLPGKISEISFVPQMGPAMDVFYEFDDQQLASLVGKGYFAVEFAVPQEFLDEEIVLDVAPNLVVVEPQQSDDAPLVFVDVPDRCRFVTDLDDSGYDFASYFQIPQKRSELESVIEAPEREMDDILRELNDQYEREAAEQSTQSSDQVGGDPDEFTRVVHQLSQDRQRQIDRAQEEQVDAQPASGEFDAQAVFEQQVAPVVYGGSQKQAAPVSQVEVHHDLDLSRPQDRGQEAPDVAPIEGGEFDQMLEVSGIREQDEHVSGNDSATRRAKAAVRRSASISALETSDEQEKAAMRAVGSSDLDLGHNASSDEDDLTF